MVSAGERSFSFEFFPPKNETGELALWDAIERAVEARAAIVAAPSAPAAGPDSTVLIG